MTSKTGAREEDDEGTSRRSSSSSSRGRTAAEVRKLKADVRVQMELGLDDDQIATELKIRITDVRYIRELLFKDELETASAGSPAEVYVRYKLRGDGMIRDLDTIILKAKKDGKGPSLNAGVAAVKVKHGILGDVLEKGQSLGVIHKEPERAVTVNGVAISDMREPELREHLETVRSDLRALLDSYVGGAAADYTEVDDEDLYPAATTRRAIRPARTPVRPAMLLAEEGEEEDGAEE